MLIFGTVLTFVSCGGGEETPTECTEHKDENGDGICDTEGCGKTVETKPAPSADVFNENGELYLFKDGVPTFQFVIGSDALAKQKANVDDLAEILNDLCVKGTEIKVVAQGEGTQEVEILIGTVTNRGDEYKINKYDYGMTGYTVKQIGTKIVVVGGSDAALESAVKHLKENVFGIKKNNEDFGTLVMAANTNFDKEQSNYSLKDITIAGDSIRNYVITYNKGDKTANDTAKYLQTALYKECGIYLNVVLETDATDAAKIAIRNIENDGEGGGFYITVDESKNLVIESEYSGKTQGLVTDYFNKNVFNKKNTYAIPQSLEYAPDLRNIYYKDFGAKGDGVTDDFFAIKAAHDEANKYYLNVHADPNATYYIGNANGSESITVKSNTYFHGCKFIFDDRGVAYDDTAAKDAPIFNILPDSSSVGYTRSKSPIKSLEKGATKTDWAPGRKVMVAIYQSEIRHYIRYGANASQNPDPSTWGQGQHELLIINADGTIDPSTPVQWTYTSVSSMTVYYVDDRPIEIKGEGDDGRHTTVTTWYNNGPNAYFYYKRNFQISRSNLLLSGLEHIYDKYVPYSEGGNGSPYNGFTSIANCNNVTIDNMIYECPPGYKDTDPNIRPSSYPTPTGAGMGSYEISASLSNNITWSNSTQSNFFQPDGGIIYDGSMGTNFCKNLTFDNMFTCSFDAHCGVYNGTIKNSTLEHINFIGDGLIKLENVTLYADANHAAINLREDYGAWWAGDIEIDGLTFKVNQNYSSNRLHIVKTSWNNWFFGYTTYLPQHITLRNVMVAQYTYTLNGEGNGTNNRIESPNYVYNALPVRIFTGAINDSSKDYGAATIDGVENKNPMVATKEIRIYTEYTGEYANINPTNKIKFIQPSGPFFKNMKYYINDELQ